MALEGGSESLRAGMVDKLISHRKRNMMFIHVRNVPLVLLRRTRFFRVTCHPAALSTQPHRPAHLREGRMPHPLCRTMSGG